MNIDYRYTQTETCKYSDLEVGDVFYIMESPCDSIESCALFMKVEIDPDYPYLDECAKHPATMHNPVVLLTPFKSNLPGVVIDLCDIYNDENIDEDKLVKVDATLTILKRR